MPGLTRRTLLRASAVGAAACGLSAAGLTGVLSAAPLPATRLLRSSFSPWVGERFTLADGSMRHAVRLTEVIGHDGLPGDDELRFVLHFTSASNEAVPEGIYRVTSDGLDGVDLFLTSVGGDAGYLEAVVSA